MIEKLVHKLTQQRRHEIRLEVRESNLAAQLFFRTHAFQATSVQRNYYDDTAEDAYVMKYLLDTASEVVRPLILRNRISEYEDA
jgi:ribosomal-protein-alanine N-acetyltransferase